MYTLIVIFDGFYELLYLYLSLKIYIYCHILALFAFGKFLLLRHVIYENATRPAMRPAM